MRWGRRILVDLPQGQRWRGRRDRGAACGEMISLGSHGNAIGLLMNYVNPAFGLDEATRVRTPGPMKVVHQHGEFLGKRSFSAGAAFDEWSADFRATPG